MVEESTKQSDASRVPQRLKESDSVPIMFKQMSKTKTRFSTRICELIERCWSHDPSKRPTFVEILNIWTSDVMRLEIKEQKDAWFANTRGAAVRRMDSRSSVEGESSSIKPLASKRRLFLLPRRPIYLSAASRSPMPRSVYIVGKTAMKRKVLTPWAITSPKDADVEERLRKLWCTLLNADSADCFAFTPSCSYAISSAANTIYHSGRVKTGDVILVLEDQMSYVQFARHVLSLYSIHYVSFTHHSRYASTQVQRVSMARHGQKN